MPVLPAPHLPAPPKLWATLNQSALVQYLLLFGCGWVTVLLINYFYNTIALFTVAGILAVLLNFPVRWLSRYLSRGWAITVVFLVAIALFFGLVAFIGLEVLNQGQGLLNDFTTNLRQQNTLPLPDVLEQFNFNEVFETLRSGLASGLGIVRSIFASVFTGIFGAVICLYMLIDGEKLWRSFLKLLPVGSRDRFAYIFQRSVIGFIRGQMLLMLFLSSTTLIAFPLLGVKYPLILALIVGVIDAIPGIGATLGISVATLLIFASQGFATALKALVVCIVLVQIQDNYVRPKVMGDALELNPVILFLSLFIGERIAGLLGIFLSIPIAGMIALWIQSSQEDASLPEISTSNPSP